MLIKGQWAKDFHPVHETDEEGGFVREDAGFRHWITRDGRPGPSGSGGFAAEPGRYHLYVALICPWASRTLMVRKLKGLEDVVSISALDPRLSDRCGALVGSMTLCRERKPIPCMGQTISTKSISAPNPTIPARSPCPCCGINSGKPSSITSPLKSYACSTAALVTWLTIASSLSVSNS